VDAPTQVVAVRVFSAKPRRAPEDAPNELRIEILVPEKRKSSDGDGNGIWFCSLRASGVISDTQTVEGLDSFQALESAFAVVVTWIIAVSSNYELRSMFSEIDDASKPPPEALTLMHGLVSAGLDKLIHNTNPR
jgi:hypothetical protein